MKTRLLIILIVLIPKLFFGQTSYDPDTKRFGFIFLADFGYNFQDKVVSAGMNRKFTLGLSITNKKQQYIGIIGIGVKGFKANLYSPTFRQPFLNDVKQNYVPIKGYSEDSLIGANMGTGNGDGLNGTYSGFFQLGFIWNSKFKPSFDFYCGIEEYLLHNKLFSKYEDPAHGDIDYVGMTTIFYEFKIGCALPPFIKRGHNLPLCAHLKVGYKLVDYQALQFKDTPLNAYTTGSLVNKYHMSGKFTITLAFDMWTNWK